jgi:hypothetical protein
MSPDNNSHSNTTKLEKSNVNNSDKNYILKESDNQLNSLKSNKLDNTENSTVLELTADFIKMNYVQENECVKKENLFKILNESTILMKEKLNRENGKKSDELSNVSNFDIENLKNSSFVINKTNDKESNESENNDSESNDSILPLEFINNLKKNNNKIIEIN